MATKSLSPRATLVLEELTLGWNVVGVLSLAIAALRAGSVALAGFGLDSAIETGASTVVIWQLGGTAASRNLFPCGSSTGRSSRWPSISRCRLQHARCSVK